MTNLKVPKFVFLGSDALEKAKAEIARLGNNALIVTSPSMIKQGHVMSLINILESMDIKSVVYGEIKSEPTDNHVNQGLDIYRKNRCDFIIAIGGGSPIDCAKAIGAMAVNEGDITEYNGSTFYKAIPPLVAIPSTGGTGSEATNRTIITDTGNNIKMLLKGDVLLPLIAVVDPKFSMQCPLNVTVATGLDALTHAVEAYTSKKAFKESDDLAIKAIRRIFKNLPILLEDLSNEKAREEMALAAYEAGICINNAAVTIVHGMSRPIGAYFHVPHGISNAMLLVKCLSYVVDGGEERFAQLGKAIGLEERYDSTRVLADKFIKALGDFCSLCKVTSLDEYGIDKEAFLLVVDKMAQDAIDSGSPANTLKELTKEDILKVYKSLW